jgi:biopolymer transport protein TolR
MAAATSDNDDAISAINVTPFVDIVLVLLIILMVTSTAIAKAALQVDLPKAASGGEQVASTVNVLIKKDGQLVLDGAGVQRRAGGQGEGRKGQQPQAAGGDRRRQRGALRPVVHVIDLVKTNGVTSFALNIERVPTPEEGP